MKKTYTPEIEECLKTLHDNIYLVYTPEYEKYRGTCEQLFSYAAEEQSAELFALAYYYMIEFLASDNDAVNVINCGHEGVKYQLQAEEYELAARTYNILGVYSFVMGEFTKAVDYYLSCIDLCLAHDLPYVRGMACCNLADLLQRHAAIDRALYYYGQSEQIFVEFAKSEPSDAILNHLASILCNEGHCFLSIHNMKEAERCGAWVERITDCLRQQDAELVAFGTYTYLGALAHAHGDDVATDRYLALAQKDFHRSDNYTDFIDDICYYARLLIRMERIPQAIEVLEYFIDKCEEDQASFYVYSTFLGMRMECAKIMRDNGAYMDYMDRFMTVFHERGIYHTESVLQAESEHREKIRLKRAQEEMSAKNEELFVQSHHDALTGLANRAYLHSYCDEMLLRAVREKVHFGVEILDVDHFKFINDMYGHMDGDRYIVEVAEVLFRLVQQHENVFAARYGGDEFVIVYFGYEDDAIRAMMQKLQDDVRGITMVDENPLGNKHVTISQGCCNRIPNHVNRVWDFLSAADGLLYGIKKEGKDAYVVEDTFDLD